MDFRSDRTVDGHAAVLARNAAASRGIPVKLARQAERITAERFADACREPLDESATRRMTAYFDAVVRRRAFRTGDPEIIAYRRRLVAASIDEDLRAASETDSRHPVQSMATLPLPLGV